MVNNILSDLLGVNVLSPTTTSYPNQSRQSYTNQSTTTSTYAPVSNTTDARQLILVLNSPYATTTTKKADNVAATSTPTSTPTSTTSPNLSGSSTTSPTTGQPSLLSGIFGDFGTPLLIGAAIIGVVLIAGAK